MGGDNGRLPQDYFSVIYDYICFHVNKWPPLLTLFSSTL